MGNVASIPEKTSELIAAIKNSAVYAEYQEALADLNTFPDLKEMTDKFRHAQYQAYHSELSVSLKLFDELEEKLVELTQYSQIDRFLRAELALSRVLQGVQSQIIGAMEWDHSRM